MKWWRRVHERKALIEEAKSGNGERAEAARMLRKAQDELRRVCEASDHVDRLALGVRRALRAPK